MKEEKIRRSDDKILTTKNNRTVESFFAFRNGNNNLKKDKKRFDNETERSNEKRKEKEKKEKERNVRRDIEKKKLKTFLTDRRVG